MKICTTTVTALLFFAHAVSYAEIDRASFFQRCEQLAKDKEYFQAHDRGKVQKFYLTTNITNGEGRTNIDRILDEIEKRGVENDMRKPAYVLGTAFRETASTMRPIHEAMRCKTEECIHKHVGAYGQRKPNDRSYYGRGFSQLTHEENYINFGKLLNLDPSTTLHDNPELALDPNYAAKILVIGMYDGEFTRKRFYLSQFFNDKTDNWIGARKIVNPGSRRAPVTAGYGKLFYECLPGKALLNAGELIE